jgi:predicted ATPase
MPPDAPRHNLPEELTSLIGRDAEIASLANLVGEQRLVTLTGPGGVGKTRLAQRLARTLLDSFADGCWFVDLAPITDPERVPSALMSVLHVPEIRSLTQLEGVADALSEQTCLIVLDNCEHLDTAPAEAVRALLMKCPTVRILATSREPLATAGECVSPIPPLATASAAGDQGGSILAPAVELFLARSRLHGMQLDADNVQTHAVLSELCRRLDGIPLAIELAAARSRSLPPEELLRRLDERFRLLKRPRHWSAAARQQTLEATIEWSYSLLSAEEQATLRRLSVLRGGFDMPAAIAVCADIGSDLDTIDRVGALVDRSLGQLQERAGVGRYRLLESIGLFAEFRLTEHGETASARERHADHFAELARNVARSMSGPEEVIWTRLLEAEEENIRSALSWCLHGSGNLQTGLDLVASVGFPWLLQGRNQETRRWLEIALAAASEAPPEVTAAILWNLSFVEVYYDEFDLSLQHAARAVDLARTTNDLYLLVSCLMTANQVNLYLGNTEAVTSALAEINRCARRASDDDRVMLGVESCIAFANCRLGHWTTARECAEAMRDRARRLGNERSEAFANWMLAFALTGLGDVALSRVANASAVRAARLSGLPVAILETIASQSSLALAEHDYHAAHAAAAEAALLAHRQQRLALVGDLFWVGSACALEAASAEEAAVLWHCSQRWWPSTGVHELDVLFGLPDLAGLPRQLRATLGIEVFEKAAVRAESLSKVEMLKLLAGSHLDPTPGRDDTPSSALPETENVFRKEGDYWAVAFAGTTIRLKDSKGLRDIARLLATPGREVAAVDLAWASGPDTSGRSASIGTLGLGVETHAGETLDAEARAEYRLRLADLQQEIADADAGNDLERASRAREEREFLVAELAAALGLGGRARKMLDPSERARKAVTGRVREAISHIEKAHLELGRHLRRSVRTGSFCLYDPPAPTGWLL